MRLFIILLLACIGIILSYTFSSQATAININFLEYPAGSERKQAFINFLQPIITEKNQSLLRNRDKLIRLSTKEKLNIREQRWLRHISQQYDFNKFTVANKDHWDDLINKVDIIPASLVLAQGAKESGWGSSRFAQQANNYFGQWCYSKGCGLVPKNRNNGTNHEVTKYESVKESVFSYINNLNRHAAYKKLRDIRQQLRMAGKEITGQLLARGLQHYSERGSVYVREIQSLIRSNKLEQL